MIVVDIGCATQKEGRLSTPEESVEKLALRFDPDILFGFDPEPLMLVGISRLYRTLVVRSRLAAWTHTGFVPFKFGGIRSAVVRTTDTDQAVPCFNLSEWLLTLPITKEEVVLKLDCEGAEYPLLRDIHEKQIDRLLKLVLVEWHNGHDPDGFYYGNEWNSKPVKLDCPVEAW